MCRTVVGSTMVGEGSVRGFIGVHQVLRHGEEKKKKNMGIHTE